MPPPLYLGEYYPPNTRPVGSTPPAQPLVPHAGAAVHTMTSTPAHARTAHLVGPKEILGVDNARVHMGAVVLAGRPYAWAADSPAGSLPPAHAAVTRSVVNLSYSSVFLSIPQYFSELVLISQS